MGSRLTECPCGCTYVTALYRTCPGDYHDEMVRVALRTLAANLAVGGALCESFCTGYGEGWDMAVRYGERAEWLPQSEYLRSQAVGDDDANDWRPGCGRAWGGGGW